MKNRLRYLRACLSFIRSYPGLNLTLLHGVRDSEDLYYQDELSAFRYLPCVSGGAVAEPTRVTDRLRTETWDPECHFYLCGAYAMIVDAQEVLAECGFDGTSVFHEAYYYS